MADDQNIEQVDEDDTEGHAYHPTLHPTMHPTMREAEDEIRTKLESRQPLE